jgi:hypothetical protein
MATGITMMGKRRVGSVAGLLLVVLVCITAPWALAQRGPGTAGVVMPPSTSGAPMAAIPPGNGVITGRVLNREDQSPISDVRVTVRLIPVPGSPQTGVAGALITTNERGEFSVKGVAAGRYSIRADALGRTRSRLLSGLLPDDIVTLSESRLDGALTILMSRTGGISGVVTGKAGTPMAGVPVRLLRREFTSPSLFWRPLPVVALTDESGQYRFTNAPPGDYILGVYYRSLSFPVSVSDAYWKPNAPGAADQLRARFAESGAVPPPVPVPSAAGTIDSYRWTIFDSLDRSLPPRPPASVLPYAWTTYSPAATTMRDAEVIGLDAGEERTGVNVSVREVAGVRVAGKLVGHPAQVAHVGLRLIPAGDDDVWATFPNEIATTVSDAEGRFSFIGVPPGAAVIQSVVALLTTQPPQPPRRATVAWVRQPVDVGARDINGLEVPIGPPLTLRGRLAFDPEGPGPFDPKPPAGIVRLMATPTLSQPPTVIPVTEPFQFAFGQLIGGRYVIDVGGAGNWMVRSVTVGGKEVLNRVFDVTGDVTDVVVTMSTAITRLMGAVLKDDGTPIEGAQVVMIPADYRRWIADGRAVGAYRNALTNAGGRFAMNGLPAGDYMLVAFASGVDSDWQSPAALDALAAVAQPVRLEAGKSTVVEVRKVLTTVPRAVRK